MVRIPYTQFRVEQTPTTTTYELTPVGQDKADSYGAGGPELAVLLSLEQHRRQTIPEIARAAHVDVGVVKGIISQFLRRGWVRRVVVPGGGEA